MDWLIWCLKRLLRVHNPLKWHTWLVWGSLSSFLAFLIFLDSCAAMWHPEIQLEIWDLAKTPKNVKNTGKWSFFASKRPEQLQKNARNSFLPCSDHFSEFRNRFLATFRPYKRCKLDFEIFMNFRHTNMSWCRNFEVLGAKMGLDISWFT